MPRRAAIIVGTRPEVIKLAPVVEVMQKSVSLEPILVSTGQHRDLLDTALNSFGLAPDFELALMRNDQKLDQFLAIALTRVGELFDKLRPELIIVEGDTTTVLAASIAAFYRRIPIAHVEAGLRTHDFDQPFPEEMNRVLAGHIARWHFAPTIGARENLIREGINPGNIHVVGNTVVDALLEMRRRLQLGEVQPSKVVSEIASPLLLVTTHRRENFGRAMSQICDALVALHDSRPDLTILLPVHLNPNVSRVVRKRLEGRSRIILSDPLNYADFVAAMNSASLILSDSGGIQEEAPSLNKPILIMRETSERPEVVAAGAARLVGTDSARIVTEVETLLDDADRYQAMASAPNPFGDGTASRRIVDVLEREA